LIAIVDSSRVESWRNAMTAHDGVPVIAGFRRVAIELMRLVFIVFSGCGRWI
jgi:hypothetical protein